MVLYDSEGENLASNATKETQLTRKPAYPYLTISDGEAPIVLQWCEL